MAVENYGVLIGPYVDFYRDSKNNEGKYLHGHVVVGVAHVGNIDCAVDCNHSSLNVNYIHLKNLDSSKLGPVTGMGDGYHALASTASSGALDYARDPLINVPLGCAALFYGLLGKITGSTTPVWTTNIGDGAVAALEQMMTSAPIDRVFVFGARWQNPAQSPPWGMHDVHCNQGDPAGQYQHLDGVWQDGAVIVRRADGGYEGFIVMFTSQTLDTDDVTGIRNIP